MPEEKIGTAVELDIANYLGGLAKMGTAWRKYLDVLEKTYPTTAKVNKALEVTTDRIKELRFSTEKLSKTQKAELVTLRKRATALKDVAGIYKTEARLLEESAKAQVKYLADVEAAWAKKEKVVERVTAAERAGAAEVARANKETEREIQATTDAIAAAHVKQQKAAEDAARKQEQAAEKIRRAAEAAARAQERQSKSWTRNLKQMLLWGIGAASAYRMFMKIRRALQETFGELYENTEEYKALTAATDKFKISLLSVLGTESDVLAFLDRTAVGLDKMADGFNQSIAAIKGFLAYQRELARVDPIDIIDPRVYEEWPVVYQLVYKIAKAAKEQEDRFRDAGRETRAAATALDTYNASIESYNKQAREAATATEDLSKAQGEAAKAYERYQQQLYKITETRLQGLLQAHRDYYDALADMALDDARRAEDLAIEAARRQEDWARDAARRRAALLRQYNKQVLQAERNYARARQRLADDRARRLLEIERRYQDRLLEIERAYSRSMYEAIATRDATAALRAMRQRKEDLADAKRDRDRARKDVESDYARRLRELRENLEEQRRQARRSYEEALEELNRNLREQEEDLAISLRRREEDAALSRQRQLQDLKRSLAEQMRAVLDQYARDRRLANIEYRYREDAFARHLARMRAIAQAYQTAFRPPATPAVGGGGVQEFAKGGAMVAMGPTRALFGERGPELVIAQPLAPAPQSFMVSGSVRHEVSTIIQQSMAGFEGRIAGAVHSALAEIIR